MSELHAHRAHPGEIRHARQFCLLLAQEQGGVEALRRDGAKQQPGDRKHQHEQLQNGEVLDVIPDEHSNYGKDQLNYYQTNRNTGVPLSYRQPDDR